MPWISEPDPRDPIDEEYWDNILDLVEGLPEEYWVRFAEGYERGWSEGLNAMFQVFANPPIDDADLFEYWEWLRRSTPATITELAERISYSLKQTKRKLDSGEEKKWMSQSWDTQKD